MHKVRVRKQHPTAPLWVLLMVLTALTIYLVTLGMRSEGAYPVTEVSSVPTAAPERVTQDLPLDALSVHLIQLNAFESADAARIEAARYVARGAAGYLLENGDGLLRVIGAGYESEEEASSVCERLLQSEGIEASICLLESAPVTLRVTASREQIDALRKAEALLRSTAAQMGQSAFALDAGSRTVLQARMDFAQSLEDARLAQEQLNAAAGETPNRVAASLLSLLKHAVESLEELSSAETQSTLSFSSKIKYNYIDLRTQHIRFLNELSA